MHSFVVHSNESACRKSGRLGLEQVKKQPSYEDEDISIGDRPITKNTPTESLEALGATLKFY